MHLIIDVKYQFTFSTHKYTQEYAKEVRVSIFPLNADREVGLIN